MKITTAYAIGDRVLIDDTAIVGTVVAINLSGRESVRALFEVSWIGAGAPQSAWLDGFRLNRVD